MRSPVHYNFALLALALTHVVEDRDAAWRLHDAAEAPAERGAEFGQSAGQAALAQRHVLRAVVAIDAAGVVARSTLGASRRRPRIVFAAGAGGRPVLARRGRLQQRETEVPIGGGSLLTVWREWRTPAIGRIDNQRRPCADALHGEEHRIVAPVDVHFGAALLASVAREHRGALSVEFGALVLGEKFLAHIFGEALQRRIELVGPDALQIGLAPWRFQRRLRGGARRGVRNEGYDNSPRRSYCDRACPSLAHDGVPRLLLQCDFP